MKSVEDKEEEGRADAETREERETRRVSFMLGDGDKEGKGFQRFSGEKKLPCYLMLAAVRFKEMAGVNG